MPSFFCLPLACNRQIDSLDRRQNNLQNVPHDIDRYRGLEELLLSMNHIKDLPKQLFKLNRLRILDLSDNDLSILPSEVSQLSSLVELNLNRNDISDLPAQLKDCKQLMTLDLSGNPFTRLPDSICECSSMTSLSLNDIVLTAFPGNLGALTNLRFLEARENLIRCLPSSVGNLTRLEVLDLGQNEIEQLPMDIGKLKNLREFYIDSNDLESLPDSITNCSQLDQLDVSENKIGVLPAELGNMVDLTDVNVSQNALQSLPSSIGRLKKLSILKADRNSITHLTKEIGECSNLVELYLTDNLLTEIPDSIGNLKRLHTLNVDKNHLSFVPDRIGDCAMLSVLSVRENDISELPMSVGMCERMKVLDVAANKLSYLPYTINVLKQLKACWLSENQMHPLNTLTEDRDPRTGIKVMTCYLLPQLSAVNYEEIAREQERAFVGGPKVHFPDQDATVEDERTIGQFERHNTPHPKPSKLKKSSIDGHVIHHDENQQPSTLVLNKSTASQQGETTFAATNNNNNNNSVPPPAPMPRSALKSYTNSPHSQMNRTIDDPTAMRSRPRMVSFSFGDRYEYDEVEEDDDEEYGNMLAPRLKRVNTPHYKTLRGPLRTSQSVMDTTLTTAVGGPPEKLHKIVMKRDGSGELGLSIAGGKGFQPAGIKQGDEGLFVTKIVPGGVAHRSGLKFGDKLIRANDRDVVDASQNEAVEAMNKSEYVVLIVQRSEPSTPLTSSSSLQAMKENGISRPSGSRESISALQYTPATHSSSRQDLSSSMVSPPPTGATSTGSSMNGLYAERGSSEEVRASEDEILKENESPEEDTLREKTLPEDKMQLEEFTSASSIVNKSKIPIKVPPPVAPKPAQRPEINGVTRNVPALSQIPLVMNPTVEQPEKLTFQSKLNKFKAIDTTRPSSAMSSVSSLPPPEKKPLVSVQDFQKLKEEETKKIAANGGTFVGIDLSPAKESNFEHLLENDPLPRQPSIIRTKKAENRAIAAGLIEPPNDDLDDEQKLKLEQQKRSDWRAARLKSLEQKSVEADAIMNRLQLASPLLSSIGEDVDVEVTSGIKKVLNSTNEEILYADE